MQRSRVEDEVGEKQRNQDEDKAQEMQRCTQVDEDAGMRWSSQGDEAEEKQWSSDEEEPEEMQSRGDQDEAKHKQPRADEDKECPGLDHPGQNKKHNSRREPDLRSGAARGGCDLRGPARHREVAQQRSTATVNRGPSGESLVWAVPYLSSGIMRRTRRWAWVMQKPYGLPPRGGILMGLQSGLPAKWLCVPHQRIRAKAAVQRQASAAGGSPGSSPPVGTIRETPSACDEPVGGPVLSSAQGSLQVITLADGGPRPLTRADLLYVRSEPVPLFVQFLQAFFTFLPWLQQALSCGVLLLMRRPHLFVLRLFVTCEDYRLRSAPDIIFNALSEFTAESWQALLHLSTSPVPQVGRVDPQLVERGLGAVGNYTISDDLWCELAPPDFEASVSDFHLGRESHSSNREALVRPMVKWLLREEIVTIMDENCPLRATCWPFVIPKSTEKMSLVFNLVEFNESLHKPLSFSLDGWEQISKKLADWPADRPLFCTHVDLKNAFWSFKLPRRHE